MSNPNLSTLSYTLRHPELWPKDFYWGYYDTDHCAMGLARALWPTAFKERKWTWKQMLKIFNMPEKESTTIFMGGCNQPSRKIWGFIPWLPKITPTIVADHIDAYLTGEL